MSRRRRSSEEELPFSLDSFLDIVANLVGILIRLIVMVGLSVRALPGPSHAMREAAETETEAKYVCELEEWNRKKDEIERTNAKSKDEYQKKRSSRDIELQARREAELKLRTRQREIDQAYDARQRAIAERLAVIQAIEQQAAELSETVDRLDHAKSHEADLFDRELAAARRVDVQAEESAKSIAVLRAELEAAQHELDAERIKRESLDDQIADLRRLIAEIEAAPKPVKAIQHDATAVASRVEIDEIHFRVKNGRIAPTYMSDLLDRLRRNVYAALDAKSPIGDGTLGPIGGFTLHYQIDRRKALLSTGAQTGSAWDVQLKRFKLVASGDDLGEPCADAVREGSELLRGLQSVDPSKKVLTCWVYPDSFAEAKKVETALHQRGFAVALRPMPEGAEISGSPSGSASDAR